MSDKARYERIELKAFGKDGDSSMVGREEILPPVKRIEDGGGYRFSHPNCFDDNLNENLADNRQVGLFLAKARKYQAEKVRVRSVVSTDGFFFRDDSAFTVAVLMENNDNDAQAAGAVLIDRADTLMRRLRDHVDDVIEAAIPAEWSETSDYRRGDLAVDRHPRCDLPIYNDAKAVYSCGRDHKAGESKPPHEACKSDGPWMMHEVLD